MGAAKAAAESRSDGDGETRSSRSTLVENDMEKAVGTTNSFQRVCVDWKSWWTQGRPRHLGLLWLRRSVDGCASAKLQAEIEMAVMTDGFSGFARLQRRDWVGESCLGR